MEKELHIHYHVFENHDALDAETRRLYEAAAKARLKAYAPYSKFLVGCALLLDTGEIVTGSNQENAAYPSGLCAERTTIFWTSANHPTAQIKKIFVVGGPENGEQSVATPPCGACRQSVLEYENRQPEPIELYFAAVKGKIFKTRSVRDLLPFSFDSSFL